MCTLWELFTQLLISNLITAAFTSPAILLFLLSNLFHQASSNRLKISWGKSTLSWLSTVMSVVPVFFGSSGPASYLWLLRSLLPSSLHILFFSPQCLLDSALLLRFTSICTTSFIYLDQMTFFLSVSFQDYKVALYFSWGEIQILQPAIQGLCFCSFLLTLSLQSGVSLFSPLGVHHRFIIIVFILSNNSQCMVAKNVYTTFTYTPSFYLLLHLLCSFHLWPFRMTVIFYILSVTGILHSIQNSLLCESFIQFNY